MKVVINEAQYNRLFNKPKTKLIITESQFNRLMVEEEVMKTFKDINLNDILKITKVNGDELHFKVITDDNSGRFFLVNGDGAVHKNKYFFVTNTSLQDGNLNYEEKFKGKIKDVGNGNVDIFNKLSTDMKTEPWQKGTFKDIKKFEVLGPDAKTVKFQVDPSKGGKLEPKNKEDFESSEATPEIERLVGELNSMREGEKYLFSLNDGNTVTMIITRNSGGSVGGEIEKGTGNYGYLTGRSFEFDSSHENINYRESNDFDIQIKVFGNKEAVDSSSNDLKMSSELEEIKGISDFGEEGDINQEKDNEKEKKKEIEEKEREERDNMVKEFNYDELKDLMGEDQILKDFIQKRPAAIFELIGLQRAHGMVPLNKIFAEWGINIKNGKGDFDGDKFKSDNNVTVRFIEKGDIIDSRHNKASQEFDDFVKDGRKNVGLKVARFQQGDLHATLKGVINKTKFNIEIISSLEDNEETEALKGDSKDEKKENDKFKVKFSYEERTEGRETGKKIDVGYYIIEVISYDAKNMIK